MKRWQGPLSRWLPLILVAAAFAGCVAPPPVTLEESASSQDEGVQAPAEADHPHEPPAAADAPAAAPDPEAAPDLTHTPPFALEEGTIPTREQARDFANRYSSFTAKGDGGLEKLRAEGHLKGSGTPTDPYVLERFYVSGTLSITSTDKPIILREGYVENQLKLNYIGEAVYVHHVWANDLRINENIKRSGPNTGGLFHDNAFAFVGQIRHFTGEFRDNTVGPRPSNVMEDYLGDTGILRVDPGEVFNFDGFHGADVHHNLFLGQVDIQLHGHNHADCLACPVHNHADPLLFPADQEGAQAPNGTDPHAGHDHSLSEDQKAAGFRSPHSVRHHSLLFRDNEIRVPSGYALVYQDRAHAGDDRTANSEPNDYLEDSHVHYQDISLVRNTLNGGGLQLDIFNADDERHSLPSQGTLRVQDNKIDARQAPMGGIVAGIDLGRAEGIRLLVEGNQIDAEAAEDESALGTAFGPFRAEPDVAGILLQSFERGDLLLRNNRVASGTYGVYARQLTDSVEWALEANEFHTTHAWRGEDVGNPPEESP